MVMAGMPRQRSRSLTRPPGVGYEFAPPTGGCDGSLVDDRRGLLVFKPSSVTTLSREDPCFAAHGSPSRSASSVAALGAILAEDSPGASSSQAEISRESVKRKKAESTTAKHKVPGPRPPAVQANKTDKWWCHGPGCGMDLGRGTKKKAQNWYRHKKNGVMGYYCPACYENWNFVLY